MTPKEPRFNEIIQLSAYTINTSVLEGEQFSNCRIIGPAVLVPTGKTSIVHCSWPGDIDAIFWEILPGRTLVIGAVEVRDCVFSGCRFESVGLAGPKDLRKIMEKGFR
jgi:hypothetical protein